MSILNFRKQRQYTKNKSGQYDLVSNWTSAETVYDRDGHCVMERLDNALLPMVDGTDNGKLLTVKNGGWAKSSSLTFDANDNILAIGDSTQAVDSTRVGSDGILVGNSMAVRSSDILLSGTWDGTNTSLTTAVNSAKGTVTQTNSTENSFYNILFSNTSNSDIEKIESTKKSQTIKYNPYKKKLIITDNDDVMPKQTDITNEYIKIGDYGSPQKILEISSTDIRLGDNNNTLDITSDDINLFGRGGGWDGANLSLKNAITALKDNLPTSTTSGGWYVTKFPNIKFAICRYVNTTKHNGGTQSYSTPQAPFAFKNATISVSASVAGRIDARVQYANVVTSGAEAYVYCDVTTPTTAAIAFTIFTDYD